MITIRRWTSGKKNPKTTDVVSFTINTKRNMFSRVGDNILLHMNAHEATDKQFYMSIPVEDATVLRDQLNDILSGKVE